MANIKDLRACLSLTDVSKQREICLYWLAAKKFTKRVVNSEAITRTFKPLWKPIREFKFRDIGGNLLLFEFEDAIDLERVLEFELWSYDKNLVVFQHAVDVESVLLVAFASINFWVLLHNILVTSLTLETSEAVGNSVGSIVHGSMQLTQRMMDSLQIVSLSSVNGP